MAATYSVGDQPIPSHRLIQSLGRGGIGEVWKAAGPDSTNVALKIIRLDGARELNSFAALPVVLTKSHSNLLPVYGLWARDRNDQWIETRFNNALPTEVFPREIILVTVLGQKNLNDRLDDCKRQGVESIPADELWYHLDGLAQVIDYLNFPTDPEAVPTPHGNIKPNNMILTNSVIQLADFGLTGVMAETQSTSPLSSSAYVAPETISDNQFTPWTDQYSLAVSYIKLRTSFLPFPSGSVSSILLAHTRGKLDLSKLPKDEQPIIRRATSVNPKDRFPTTAEMVAALRQTAKTPPKK